MKDKVINIGEYQLKYVGGGYFQMC